MNRELKNLYELLQSIKKEKFEERFTILSNDEEAERLARLANLFYNYDPNFEEGEYNDNHVASLAEFAHYYKTNQYKKAADCLEDALLSANLSNEGVYNVIMFQLERTLG